MRSSIACRDTFWREPVAFGRSFGFRLAPAVDETEDEKAYHIAVDLPGLDPKDVELSLSDNVLTIRGEKKTEKENGDGQALRRERLHGAFRRSIAFPAEIDEDKVEASFRNGVLTVTLPKTKEARNKIKRIEVKSH